MAKFRFALESVLKYRGRLEEEAKRAFAEAQRRVDEQRAKIDAMYRRADEVREEILGLERAGSGRDLELVRESEGFLIGHARRIQAERQTLAELLGVLEDAQEHLVHAAREKKVLVKLREARRSEFVQRLDRLEALELDEMATVRAAWGKQR